MLPDAVCGMRQALLGQVVHVPVAHFVEKLQNRLRVPALVSVVEPAQVAADRRHSHVRVWIQRNFAGGQGFAAHNGVVFRADNDCRHTNVQETLVGRGVAIVLQGAVESKKLGGEGVVKVTQRVELELQRVFLVLLDNVLQLQEAVVVLVEQTEQVLAHGGRIHFLAQKRLHQSVRRLREVPWAAHDGGTFDVAVDVVALLAQVVCSDGASQREANEENPLRGPARTDVLVDQVAQVVRPQAAEQLRRRDGVVGAASSIQDHSVEIVGLGGDFVQKRPDVRLVRPAAEPMQRNHKRAVVVQQLLFLLRVQVLCSRRKLFFLRFRAELHVFGVILVGANNVVDCEC